MHGENKLWVEVRSDGFGNMCVLLPSANQHWLQSDSSFGIYSSGSSRTLMVPQGRILPLRCTEMLMAFSLLVLNSSLINNNAKFGHNMQLIVNGCQWKTMHYNICIYQQMLTVCTNQPNLDLLGRN